MWNNLLRLKIAWLFLLSVVLLFLHFGSLTALASGPYPVERLPPALAESHIVEPDSFESLSVVNQQILEEVQGIHQALNLLVYGIIPLAAALAVLISGIIWFKRTFLDSAF